METISEHRLLGLKNISLDQSLGVSPELRSKR